MSPAPLRATALYRFYRHAMTGLVPLAWWLVSRKLKRQGVPAIRMHERLGHASIARPPGPLVWFHGASVGESLSVLTLIDALLEQRPDLHVLMTSGTATSAEILARRMPPGCQHQFAPLDAPGAVARFLDFWRPQAGIFVDSEIWPNMLVMARDSGTRLALVNARLSQKSVEGWQKFPDTAAFVLDQFDLIVAQNRASADMLRQMGAQEDRLKTGLNLKSTAKPLPLDEGDRARLSAAIGLRPLWCASSTHPGEEEIALTAHKRLLRSHPDALLILVPRHPDRGDAVADLIARGGLTGARRTLSEPITETTQVYLADTLGEMGLFYALSPIVLMGGSLVPIGGHNPYEPAQFGAALLTGPHVSSFSETYEPLISLGGAVTVEDADALERQLARLIAQPDAQRTMSDAASGFAARGAAALAQITDDILAVIDGRA
jgi:3-deoxy-D-manno-octulosonic-acid transferase